MKYIDYREKLGIGFNDKEKAGMLADRILLFFDLLPKLIGTYNIDYLFEDISSEYFLTINEYPEYGSYGINKIKYNILSKKDIKEIVSRFVIFANISTSSHFSHNVLQTINDFLPETLDNINIQYEILSDSDGSFIFPKGAEELDSVLVSEPLEWLKDYPQTKKTYVIALKQYSDGIYIRDVADNLRKTLEAFFQEFLGNKKNLANNINEVFKFLGTHNAEPELAGSIKDLLSKYDSLNNKIAKHNDKVDARYLEFLLYQTGIFIRMLITVKNTDAKESLNAN